MVKKFIIIVVTFCYLLSVTGASIDHFYCCGKLKKTSLFFNLSKNSCSKKKGMKGCCKYEESFYKVKDNHETSIYTALSLPVKILPDYLLAINTDVAINTSKGDYLYYPNSPPPLLNKPTLFLLNCNFRI